MILLIVLWQSKPWLPSYKGHNIEEWFNGTAANKTNYREARIETKAAFRAMGDKAVPYLISRLEEAPNHRILDWLKRYWSTGANIYRQQKTWGQSRSASLLGKMGINDDTVIKSLSVATNSHSWSLRGSATVALAKIRKEPVQPFIEKLRELSDPILWYQQAMMVAAFEDEAEPAIPIFLDAINHTNNIIQAHAIIAVGLIGLQPEKCIPQLTPFLDSPSISDRQKAMSALLMFGTNALPAKPIIKNLLNDPDRPVRNRAEHAMELFKAAEKGDF